MTLYNFLMTYEFKENSDVKINVAKDNKDDGKVLTFKINIINEDEGDKVRIIEDYLDEDFRYLEVRSIENNPNEELAVWVYDY